MADGKNFLIFLNYLRDSIGKEVFAKYESTIRSDDIYYTDVNGMKMEKRIRNYRYFTEKV